MKIKVRLLNGAQPLTVIKKGDWIDLKANDEVVVTGPHIENNNVKFEAYKIPLGIAMKLPKGYEAIIAPRSSMFKQYDITQWNSIGVVDNTYCGNNDEWGLGVIAYANNVIPKDARICQFRIQLSQKATIWQKIKWLFTSKIEFEYVDDLNSIDRNGFGEGTGK